MSKLDNEIVDPIILAAMIEDPDEDEDDKKLREQMLGTSDTTPAKGSSPKSDEDEDEDDKPDDEEEDEDKDDKKPKSDDDEEDPDKPKKPIEAQDDPEDEDEDQPKKTRKEKRQERQQDFIASIRKENAGQSRNPNIPDYKPLNYDAVPKDENGEEREFKPEELVQDREMFGAVQFAQGAKQVREAAEQDRFWNDLGTEAKIAAYDPKLSFLAETTPDGKKNPDFDPDKAEEINELYLQLCGAQQFQATDNQGRPLFNRATGQPVVMIKVQRTDLSYEKFARRYVERMQDWASDFADDRVDENTENLTKQRRQQSIRPNGGKRKTLGSINPGDISKMSDEDYEKNEAEIDRQIDAMLGL